MADLRRPPAYLNDLLQVLDRLKIAAVVPAMKAGLVPAVARFRRGSTSTKPLADVLRNICGVSVISSIPKAELRNVLEALGNMPQVQA